jgi:hypothetical protein
MHLQRAAWGVFVVGLLGFAGCANDNKAEVTGSVRFDGKPVEKAILTFTPVDGSTPTSGGHVLNGQYSSRVYLGKTKVSISMSKVIGMKKLYPDDPNSKEYPVTGEVLPARYNKESELFVDVKPGTNVENFNLKSD